MISNYGSARRGVKRILPRSGDLRCGVEMLLPVREGEKRLTARERSAVFQGKYWMPGGKITAVTETRNIDTDTRKKHPYSVRVTREALGRVSFGGESPRSYVYKDPTWPIADKMRSTAMLERIDRVERVARRAKAVIVLGLAAAAIASFVKWGSDTDVQSLPADDRSYETVGDSVQRPELIDEIQAEQSPQAHDLPVYVRVGYEHQVSSNKE